MMSDFVDIANADFTHGGLCMLANLNLIDSCPGKAYAVNLTHLIIATCVLHKCL